MVVAGRPARLAYLPERALPDALASLSEADFAAMCPVSARLLSGKATRYDGEPGVCVSYTLDQELAGLSFRTVFLQHTVFWRERAVVLQCGVGDVPESEEMQAAFEDAKPTFTLMGASIVLLDKWEGEQAEGVGDAGAISSGDRVRGLGREQQHLGIRIIGQLIGMLIGAAIGSLLGAVVLQIATHWACKFRPPYGMAYKACFLVWAPSFVLGYATGFALGGAGVRLGWAGIIALEAVGVFFGAAIYGALLKHPDSRRSVGFGKGCVVSLFVLFVRVLILLAAIMVARMVTLDWPW